MKKLTLLLPLLLAGCVTVSNDESGMKKIAMSQYLSHPVLDAVIQGVKDGFQNGGYEEGKNISFELQNAQGDSSANQAIAQKFASGAYDLYLPIGTVPSQAIVNLVKDRPVVFGAVTDPLSAGLVTSIESPGKNVTGTSDITLYQEQLELLKQLIPNAKTVGVVYNPSEPNARYAVEQVQKYAKDLGLEIKTASANNGGEVMAAAQSIIDSVDAFYMPPDNTVVAAQEALIKVTIDGKKPLISIDESGVEKGALATLGTNYAKVGERTAEIAIRVLKGENPGSISVLGVTDADIFINKKTAEALGIEISDEMIKTAKKVYE